MHPFTGFVAAPWADSASGARGTLAVLSRGSREYEIVESREKSEIAMTLFRSVGWLSRADLDSRTGHAGIDIPTPEAQEQGHLSFEYALTTRAETASALQDEWEDYRCPADVVTPPALSGHLGAEASLMDVEGQGVTFSSLAVTAANRVSLRFFESEGMAKSVALKFHVPALACWKTRLDGTRLRHIALSHDGHGCELDVAPHEIVTLEIEMPRAPTASFGTT
jgi:alpha-mannosidase